MKQIESTCKNYVIKGVLPLPGQRTKHAASGRVGTTADMKRQSYRVKIKLDETTDIKSKIANISNCSKKNEAKIDQRKEVKITVVEPLENVER